MRWEREMTFVVTLPHGAPVQEALRVLIAGAKQDDPLAPVTVVVPSNYAGLSLRAQLGLAGPVVNVRFLVLARLAELLGAPRLAGRRKPLTPWKRAEAIRASLVGHTGIFQDLQEHPATEHALDVTFRDLRQAHEGALDHLAGSSRRGAEVVALYRRFRQLTGDGYDTEDLAEAAAAAVLENSPTLRDVGRVILYVPRSLSPEETALIRALIQQDMADIIFGLTDEEQVDQDTRDLAAMLGLDISMAISEGCPLTATGILRAVDLEEEVRSVIRRVSGMVQGGTRLHRIGVLFGSAETYGPMLQEQFRAAGIPFHGPPLRPLSHAMAGRVLLGMLRLPASNFRRTAVMEWMTSGPIVETWTGERAGRWIPAHSWDEVSRDAGVVKGMSQWQTRLETWAKQERQRPYDTERVMRLGEFVAELQERLVPPAVTSLADLANWALGLLDRYLGSETAAGGWENDAETAAYQDLRKQLQAIADTEPLFDPDTGEQLSPLSGLLAETKVQVFVQALEQMLGQPSGRLGQFGDGVFIGPISMARGMSFDRLFVVGMTEGSVPGSVREDPLLPDAEREVAGFPQRDHRRVEARGDYLAALATAPERILSAPQSSLRGQSKELPSRWLLESASVLDGEEMSSERFDKTWTAPWLTAVASFEHALGAELMAPASSQEWELRSILRTGDPRSHFLGEERAFAAGIEATTVRLPRWARRYEIDRASLSPWAGAVGAGVSIDSERPYSPTAFETLAGCAFRYFLRHVLSVKETARPEQIQQISGADRGNIIHNSLERFLREVEEAGRSPSPDEEWAPADRRRLLAIGEEECERAYTRGITGSELLWHVDRARIRRDLSLFLDADNRVRREARARFAGAEHSFGTTDRDGLPETDSWKAMQVETADGRRIGFRGRIDRIDRTEDGGLIVYDYKSGRQDDFRDIARTDRLMGGRRLQLPIYGLAARRALGDTNTPVGAYYWFVSERERFERIGYALTPDDEERLVEVLGVLAATVEAGTFPQVPGPPDWHSYKNCKYCPFDAICPGGDRAARWEEAQGAPALLSYVALSQTPEVDDDV